MLTISRGLREMVETLSTKQEVKKTEQQSRLAIRTQIQPFHMETGSNHRHRDKL